MANLDVTPLAKALKISRQHIYDVEAGHKGLTVARLQQFAQKYGVTVDALLKQDAPSKAEPKRRKTA